MVKGKVKSDITLIADFGGSGTKAIYWNPKSDLIEARSLFLGSQVINASSLDFEHELASIKAPEDRCCFEIEGRRFAVGYLAELHNAHEGLGQSKYLRAVLKVLALISVIVEKEKQLQRRKKPLQLSLVIFLPHGEASNVSYFKAAFNTFTQGKIKTAVGDFELEIKFLAARSEGEGIYRSFPEEKQRAETGLLMVGYRNSSFLVCRSGTVVDGHTTDLGMIRMVEQVGKAEGITDYSLLTQAIAIAGFDLHNQVPFHKLLANESDFLKETRINNLVEAIKVARSNYVNLLISKLRDVMSSSIDEMVLAGGTATLLEASLSDSLNESFPWLKLNWHGGLTVPSSLVPDGDPYGRFADIYGEYLALSRNKLRTKKMGLHFIDGEKGGVGKSFFATMLTEYCLQRKIPFRLVDADDTVPDVYNSYPTLAEQIYFGDNESQQQVLDDLFVDAASEVIIINLPSRIKNRLEGWIDDGNILKLAKKGINGKSIEVYRWFLCTGQTESVKALTHTLEKYEKKLNHILVKNEGMLTREDWQQIERDESYDKLVQQNTVATVILPKLSMSELARIAKKKVSLGEARRNPDALTLVSRSRFESYLQRIFQNIFSTQIIEEDLDDLGITSPIQDNWEKLSTDDTELSVPVIPGSTSNSVSQHDKKLTKMDNA